MFCHIRSRARKRRMRCTVCGSSKARPHVDGHDSHAVRTQIIRTHIIAVARGLARAAERREHARAHAPVSGGIVHEQHVQAKLMGPDVVVVEP